MRTWFGLVVVLSVSAMGQSPGNSKTFLIADVHKSPFTSNPFMHGNSIQGGRYFLTQATMVDLIATAYGVDGVNVHGGPTWLELDRYDIRAKVPPHTTQQDVKLMLRSLLADRFHLVVKTGSAPMPTYVLSAGPGKPKMTESEGTGEGTCMPQPPPANPPAGAPTYITVNCKGL